MYSVDDKIKFNKKHSSFFGYGYILGAKTYRDYPRHDKERSAKIKKGIDQISADAKKGDKFSQGFMCAFRDCANERKKNY